MVTITSHIFINIFQMVHFSAVKFTRVMRKIWAFFWYQNLWKFEKNLKRSDRAPLKELQSRSIRCTLSSNLLRLLIQSKFYFGCYIAFCYMFHPTRRVYCCTNHASWILFLNQHICSLWTNILPQDITKAHTIWNSKQKSELESSFHLRWPITITALKHAKKIQCQEILLIV